MSPLRRRSTADPPSAKSGGRRAGFRGGAAILITALVLGVLPGVSNTLAAVRVAGSGKLIDLGPRVYPLDVTPNDRVLLGAFSPLKSGGVWIAGKISAMTAPANDPSAQLQLVNMNALGVVAGSLYNAKIAPGFGYWESAHAKSFVEVSLAGLHFPDGKAATQFQIAGIDSAGDVAGSAETTGATETGGLFVAGKNGLPLGPAKIFTQIGGSQVNGFVSINAHFALVGDAATGRLNLIRLPFTNPSGITTDLEPTEIHSPFGMLNGSGTVVSTQSGTFDEVARAVGGSETVLIKNGDQTANGYVVNNAGVVAGAYLPNGTPQSLTAAIWSPSGSITPISSLASSSTGWTFASASGINDGGDVVGSGTVNQIEHGYLLRVSTRVKLSGHLWIADCGQQSCSRAGAKGEQIVVAGKSDTGQAVRVGTRSLSGGGWSVAVPSGKYVVTPAAAFFPSSRTVPAATDVAGIDFASCGKLGTSSSHSARVSGSGTRGCPDAVDWKMEDRAAEVPAQASKAPLGIILQKDIYSPYSVRLYLSIQGTILTPAQCGKVSVWKWSVVSKPAGAQVSGGSLRNGCDSFMQVNRHGVYKVAAKRYVGGKLRQTITQKVTVKDLLIVGIGDSNGSGEGDPPFWFDQCNRGSSSYQYQTAQLLGSQSHLHASVTFVSASCSGARIAHLINTRFDGVRHGPPLLPQIQQIQNALRAPAGQSHRPIDAALVSIGVNDVAFGPILEYCISSAYAHPLSDCENLPTVPKPSTGFPASFSYDKSSKQTLGDLIDGLVRQLPSKYSQLSTALAGSHLVKPSQVYLTQYPSFFYKDAKGDICTGSGSGVSNIHASTWKWLTFEANKLNHAVLNAAAANGWNTVQVPRQLFFGHGYCSKDSWFVSLLTAVGYNWNLAGAFHPTMRGAHVTAVLTLKRICPLLGDKKVCKSFPPP